MFPRRPFRTFGSSVATGAPAEGYHVWSTRIVKLVLPSRRLMRLGIQSASSPPSRRSRWSGSLGAVSAILFNGSFSSSLDGWLPWQATLVRIEHGDHKTAVRVVSTGRTVACHLYTRFTPSLVLWWISFPAHRSQRTRRFEVTRGTPNLPHASRMGRPTETCMAQLHDRINALAPVHATYLHVAQAW